MSDSRRCRDCEKLKHIDSFYGRSTQCKECAKDYQHNYYHKLIAPYMPPSPCGNEQKGFDRELA